MSKTTLSAKEILHRPPRSVLETLPEACWHALWGIGLGMGLVLVRQFAGFLWRWNREGGAPALDLGRIGIQLLAWGAVCGLGFGVWKVFALSRRLLDKSFHWFALGVTCIGFAMLLWFLGSLAFDSYEWFGVMDLKIAQENQAIQEELKRLDHSLAQAEAESLRDMKREVDQEADPEEKKAIEKFYIEKVIPKKLADIKANLEKDRQIYQSLLRPTPNAWERFLHFLTAGPSDEKTPQDAGIFPALIGSILIGLITIFFAVPLGVGAAIYLEEYRAKGWLNKLIQVNITNLAAVPSVFYGILGAYVFVELIFKNLQGEMWTPSFLAFMIGQSNAEAFMHGVFGDKIAARNLLGGGLSLALLTLPVVIVASQEAVRAVPQSLRHAALALGATKWQSIWHHVLPQARSGILTGVILALSRAIGEAAPLVMFGALTLVTYNPKLLTPFTVMPLQIFNWAGRSVDAWKYNAALASLVLMTTLLVLNGAAIWLRQRARKGLKAS